METDLPTLCRRVWGLEEKTQPRSMYWDNDVHRWMVDDRVVADDHAESMIRDAAMRWLLENVDNTLNSDTSLTEPTEYAFWVNKSVRYWEEQPMAWVARHTDLTTCLLLAVERCHEYKNKENK